MHNASNKFLIKYLLIMLLAVSAMQIKKNLLPELKQETFKLEFLNLDKNIVDSIIATMDDSVKIKLILGKNLFFIDTLDYNQISDTTFLNQYYNNFLNSLKREKKQFYAYYPLQNKFDNPADSTFFRFLIERYKQINTIADNKGILVGWIYTPEILEKLKEITDTLKVAYKLQQNFLKSGNSFHIFENKYVQHTHFDFEGLKICKLSTQTNDEKKEVLNFLNSDFQILLSDSNSQAGQILSDLIKKYSLYRKLFYKKLRKTVKVIYHLEKKSYTAPPSIPRQNNMFQTLLKEKSIFIIQKNKKQKLPLSTRNTYSIIDLTDSLPLIFKEIFINYTTFRQATNLLQQENYRKRLNRHRHIILLNDSTFKKISTDSLNKLLALFPKEKTILINFGKFEKLQQLNDSLNIIQMPDNSNLSYQLAPQVLFGGQTVSGQIPHTLNKQIVFGKSIRINATRLGYTKPERVNISSKKLKIINHIVYEAINEGAFPGCQILVARKGKVILNKSYGTHTYDKKHWVNNWDLYDIASLTKISATTIATMKMLSEQKLNIYDELGKFFKNTTIDYTRIKPDTTIRTDTFYIAHIENINDFIKNKDTIKIDSTKFIIRDTIITKLSPKTNIFKVQLIDLLKHKSGISPSLPIYKYVYYRYIFFKDLIKIHKHYQKQLSQLLRLPYIEIPDTILMQMHLPDSIDSMLNTELKTIYFRYFSRIKTDSSTIQICDSLYLKNAYFDTIWRDTKQLPVANKKYTKYSDINMILLQMAIDSLNKTNINNYLQKNIYKPLGLKNITYLPLKHFDKQHIIPTENDRQWRYTLLQGYVHDPSAAIVGGIAGNAGLFANAHDLGVLMQMVLNGGSYGGKQFIHPEIIKQFTTKQENGRGLGFDMHNSYAVIGDLAPENTYGHSGFTGTCIWVDPENELIYIFLSNRVYPSAKNWKIIQMHVRERIHDAIYEAIED